MPRNNLDRETSPYLLQHKDNPVHWQAWGPEALAAARREDKPILLSVGYAACHWCHVMAHESFENSAIADRMNKLFINIKVDREERPDIDVIYQSALALLGQSGGWPLTMFLTPAAEPFWGGTYFPPTARYGRPGFPEVLTTIAEVYRREPAKVGSNVAALRQALTEMSSPAAGGAIPLAVNARAARQLLGNVDMVHGGIGGAPKFPHGPALELLWRHWRRGGDEQARDAVLLTLNRMCQGGIYDHLGGGFARYAVDAEWLVPHFEKMLYDNAQLIDLLTLVWQESNDPLFRDRVVETAEWTMREMRAAPGKNDQRAFASSLDADSEHEEGKFYVWREAEIDALLGADAALFKSTYDVSAAGNWESSNILNRSGNSNSLAPADEGRLAACRATLLAARARRVRPGWDDKVLADWNGMMIAALAFAGAVFDRAEWLQAAGDAFRFVQADMVFDGKLRHSWRQGEARHPATLDDYAHLCRAALQLHEAAGDRVYLEQAAAWVEILDRQYWDPAGHGYFFVADDTTDVLLRTKTAIDNAVPAGNGIMVQVLARLFYLTGRDGYRERAEETVAAFSGDLDRNVFGLATLLNGSELLQTAQQIVIVGDRAAPDAQALLRAVHGCSVPNRILAMIDGKSPLPANHPAHGKGAVGGNATAYVCRGATCSLPIITPAGLGKALAVH